MALAAHTAYLVVRGVMAKRIPLSNQFEFSLAFSWGVAVLLTVLYGFLVSLFSNVKANYPALIIAAVLMSLFSIVGDLVASLVKRHYQIKDFGWLLPGHGGVLDRFDSVLASAAILIILYDLPLSFRLFT